MKKEYIKATFKHVVPGEYPFEMKYQHYDTPENLDKFEELGLKFMKEFQELEDKLKRREKVKNA